MRPEPEPLARPATEPPPDALMAEVLNLVDARIDQVTEALTRKHLRRVMGSVSHPAANDVEQRIVAGWMLVPLREFVLELRGRPFAEPDDGAPPVMMSDDVLQATTSRISEHVHQHELREIHVILRGEGPLLPHRDAILQAVAKIRAAMRPLCQVSVTLQLDREPITEADVAALIAASIPVGVTYDSAEDFVDDIELLAGGPGREVYAGLLATVDLSRDPVEMYETLLRLGPPVMDLRLPDASWSHPPPGSAGVASTPYGDWLIAVFDRWYGAPRQETRIRFFEDLLALLLGGQSGSLRVGLSPGVVVMVRHDGAIESAESTAASYVEVAYTGLDVMSDTFDAALRHPAVAVQQLGTEALSSTCRQCPIVHVCGGGLYSERYRAGEGFSHPSVYCADLMKLIRHVRDRVVADLSTRMSRS